MFEKLLPYDVAHLILVDYLKYYHQFKRITKRAKVRFEHRDWHGTQSDSEIIDVFPYKKHLRFKHQFDNPANNVE